MQPRHGSYTLQSEPLLPGDDGTAQTVARIRPYVEQGKKDPFVNHRTGTILRDAGVKSYDWPRELRTIFEWVLRNIRFQRDPEGKECLRPARTTLEWGFGDCDDINAILLPSMLGAVGFPVRLVTIASHPSAPEQFSHVYCEALLNGKWIPVDAARKDTVLGVAPRNFFRKRVWSLTEDAYEDLRGLSCGACGACAGCSMRRRTLGTHLRLSGRQYPASGLGQGFDWGGFADALTAGGKAATSAIIAANAPAGIVYPSSPYYPPPVVPPAGGVSAVGTIGSGTLILLAAVAGLLLLRK